MQIAITFLNGSDYWKQKVQANALKVQALLSDPDFLATVAAHPAFDFTSDSSQVIAAKLMNAGTVTIKVGFYSKLLTKAIAYEEDSAVYFNTRKEAYGAGDWGNVMHETMHALGYSHNGNSPVGQANTVPWMLPTLAQAYLDRKLAQAPANA